MIFSRSGITRPRRQIRMLERQDDYFLLDRAENLIARPRRTIWAYGEIGSRAEPVFFVEYCGVTRFDND